MQVRAVLAERQVLLTKDQALAVMDAHLVRVEAERKRRLEKRVSRLSIVYPALRRVPLEERMGLVEEARRYARRRWTTYLILVLIIAALSFSVLYEPIFRVRPRVSVPAFVLIPLSFALARFVMYLHIRPYLDGVVLTRYPRHD